MQTQLKEMKKSMMVSQAEFKLATEGVDKLKESVARIKD